VANIPDAEIPVQRLVQIRTTQQKIDLIDRELDGRKDSN